LCAKIDTISAGSSGPHPGFLRAACGPRLVHPCSTRSVLWSRICRKCICGRGFAPDPTLESAPTHNFRLCHCFALPQTSILQGVGPVKEKESERKACTPKFLKCGCTPSRLTVLPLVLLICSWH